MAEPHRARKRFGQNFLHDSGVVRHIVNSIAPRADDHLVEIGPGQGALTAPLLATGCRLDAVELDRDLGPPLSQRFGASAGFRLHQGDALRFDFASLAEPGERLRIVGNLPYNISTPLLFHLLGQLARIRDMHFMLQLEVVQRLAALPGDKRYGRLGVMVQYHCSVENLFTVPPEAFSPRPKVHSAVVRLRPHDALPAVAREPAMLDQVVRQAFAQRRKTLRNALKALLHAADLEQLGIDPLARPETLTPLQFVTIANRLSEGS